MLYILTLTHSTVLFLPSNSVVRERKKIRCHYLVSYYICSVLRSPISSNVILSVCSLPLLLHAHFTKTVGTCAFGVIVWDGRFIYISPFYFFAKKWNVGQNVE